MIPEVDLTSVTDMDWLTNELQQEIMSHYPLVNVINRGDHHRCKASFHKHDGLEISPLVISLLVTFN
jgi:hypothetical protein